ncbi:hypothetical protein D3C71_1554500 [compost metagenome]
MYFWMRSNWALFTTGPMVVAASCGEPTWTFSLSWRSNCTSGSSCSRCTRIRVGEWHDWPVLEKDRAAFQRAAAARSASGRMMFADFPPSSWETRLTVAAAASAT